MFYGSNKAAIRNAIERALAFHKYSTNISEECPIFPEHVHIEPTNACNLKCIHCHQSMAGTHFTKKRGFMKVELFKKVIDEIKGRATRITLNQQGEPLLHPNLLEMVAYAKSNGLAVSILTNATKLSEEMTEELVRLQLDRIVFSFEGSNQAVHEKIRRGSNYYATLKNILYFIKHNYEQGQKTFICMSMVDSSYAHEDVDSYKSYFSALPINAIFVNPLLTMSGAAPTSDEIDMQAYQQIPVEEIPICRLPWESIVVNWDGTISPCAVDFNECHIIGDANEENLIEIFNSERMRRFRKCHIEKQYEWIEQQGPLCGECNCRFNEDYDLRDSSGYVLNYIMRQLEGNGAPEATEIMQKKYDAVLRELNKVAIACDGNKQ